MGRHATPPPSPDFGKLPSEILAAKIKTQLAEATERLSMLEASRGDLAMAAVDDMSQLDAYQAHVASIDATAADLRRLRDALEAAERRVEEDFAKARAANKRKEIDRLLKMFGTRDAIGADVERLIGELAKKFRELVDAGQRIRDASGGLLPTNMPGFLVGPAEVDAVVSNQYWKASGSDVSAYITGNPNSIAPPPSLPGAERPMRTGDPRPFTPADSPSLTDRLKDASEFARMILHGERTFAGPHTPTGPPSTWIWPGHDAGEVAHMAAKERGAVSPAREEPAPSPLANAAKRVVEVVTGRKESAAVPRQEAPQSASLARMPGETEDAFRTRYAVHLANAPIEPLTPEEKAALKAPPTGPKVTAAEAMAIVAGHGPTKLIDGAAGRAKKSEDW